MRPEHRQGLTPVLLRILFGRMQSKAGAKQTGKQANLHRQGLILRYLAGFSDAEVDVFLDLAFQLFRSGDSAGDWLFFGQVNMNLICINKCVI